MKHTSDIKMERKSDDSLSTLTKDQLERLKNIMSQFSQIPGNMKEQLSWFELLAPITSGALLAKILYKLKEPDLVLMCRVSKKDSKRLYKVQIT